ncbi:MAG: hypothetical protein HKN31_03010 [Pricia sp.]|nr:hypothetical protein [Pricia sp.]
MKKYVVLLISVFLLSCSNDKSIETPKSAKVALDFEHSWDDTEVTRDDFNTIQYVNANGDHMSIERLRYLISEVTFVGEEGEIFVSEGYNLVNLSGGTGLTYELPINVPYGIYSKVSFTFGFDNENNMNGAYPDLNSVLWNVPEMLGGGYHYMQLEGKFLDDTDTDTGYQYHAIRAVDNSGENLVFEDTFFTIDLGTIEIKGDATLKINMNIAEWFKNPNVWDLNELHSMMMPNFDAQKKISQNGKNVFSLERVMTE